MKERLEEELCKSAFDEYLKQYELGPVNWAAGDEPPDYYAHIQSAKFAVEVTSIMPKHILDDYPIPARGISKSLDNVLDKIKSEAQKRDILHGTYIIYLQPINDFKSMKPILIDEILAFIERTKFQEQTSKEEIMSPDKEILCSIKKVHNNKNRIGGIKYSRLGSTWEGDIENTLNELIPERLSEKTHRLRNIQEPIILLLWDDYHKAKSPFWVDAVSTHDTNKFHTIARVVERNSQLYCQILHSKEEAWLPTE